MKKSLKRFFLISCCIASGMLFAGEDTIREATSSFQETKTIFMDVSVRKRRKGAAENLTALYAEEAKQGWRVVDLELYVEDNDLEGFFVTFARNILR